MGKKNTIESDLVESTLADVFNMDGTRYKEELRANYEELHERAVSEGKVKANKIKMIIVAAVLFIVPTLLGAWFIGLIIAGLYVCYKMYSLDVVKLEIDPDLWEKRTEPAVWPVFAEPAARTQAKLAAERETCQMHLVRKYYDEREGIRDRVEFDGHRDIIEAEEYKYKVYVNSEYVVRYKFRNYSCRIVGEYMDKELTVSARQDPSRYDQILFTMGDEWLQGSREITATLRGY